MPKTQLLLLPGLLCDKAVWEEQSLLLSDIAECIVPEYGLTGSISAMARGVLREAPKRFSLAGHSMGGRVALEIMRLAPERVERLALLDTGFHGRAEGAEGAEESQERFALLALARSQGMRAMGRKWIEDKLYPDRLDDEPLMTAILAMIDRSNPELFHGHIAAQLERPNAEPVLAGIACPTLILCGREDLQSPVARHEKMAVLIPAAMLCIIERCGHISPMERPATVTDAMRDWLASNGAKAARSPKAVRRSA